MITPEQIDGLRRRGQKFQALLKQVKAASDTDQNNDRQELEKLQAETNAASKLIPSLSAAEKKKKITELKPLSDRIAELKKMLSQSAEVVVPNIPQADVPDGDNETGNVVLREVGEKPDVQAPRDYLDLAESLNLIDVKRAAKVSGSRFGYILGPLAQMQLALVQYAQSKLLPNGFTMVTPPVMIKDANMAAMGYLAGEGESETYHLAKDGLYLVGTSEQSIGPMHRDETFATTDLPRRYLAYSTCFRREAGSYGKDTKGILRVHQFNKLEMFSITSSANSEQEHEWLLAQSEALWQGLEIRYRVLKLCAGDLGWASARTYDIEAWLPGQKEYREMGSISTTTDYQSRRLGIRVATGEKKEFTHLLNGTVFSDRALIAIIENYQQPDGSITVPKVLQPYMSGLKKIG